MRWEKRGIVFRPAPGSGWGGSGAMLPVPIRLSDDVVRVYATYCDEAGMGRPGFVEVSARDPSKVLRVSDRPCLDIGRPGTFDENGVVACSVVAVDATTLYMYYVGFELGTRIRYRLLTGLAVSRDGGITFERVKTTPILERSPAELFFRCGPFVVRDGARYRMWYIAGSRWADVAGKQVPEYVVKYMESPDGIAWPEEGRVCIDIGGPDEHGFGRPWVMRRPDGGYEMFYSVRRRSVGAYRLGYAVSRDGLAWQRRDNELGLDVSPGAFDAHAIMYSAVMDLEGRRYCFYNGDDFGREGIGLAQLASP
jgi:hypothetical protein